jgi:hypothetical protein
MEVYHNRLDTHVAYTDVQQLQTVRMLFYRLGVVQLYSCTAYNCWVLQSYTLSLTPRQRPTRLEIRYKIIETLHPSDNIDPCSVLHLHVHVVWAFRL